jgi:hypothetical protein
MKNNFNIGLVKVENHTFSKIIIFVTSFGHCSVFSPQDVYFNIHCLETKKFKLYLNYSSTDKLVPKHPPP